MIVRDEISKAYLGIKCDLCPVVAPPTEEIMRGHGLVNMGWKCSGGSHICPECLED